MLENLIPWYVSKLAAGSPGLLVVWRSFCPLFRLCSSSGDELALIDLF